MNLENKKIDFPMLVSRPELTYLDTGASSQTPRAVIDAVSDFYNTCNANVHRGIYDASLEATKRYEGARRKIATFIGAEREELIFTSGTTMSLNLLAYSLGSTLGPGDEVVTTKMEHHSNFVPWQQLAKRFGFSVKLIEVTQDGELDMNSARTLIGSQTKIVSFVYMSNSLGTINPVKELCALAHEHGALAIVDGAQSVAHMPTNVKEIDCDFFAFSGHKMMGPKGIGCLYGKKEELEKMPPFLFGGDMIAEVTLEDTSWNELPYKFEAGTPNMAGAIGLGAAVDYLQSIGMEKIGTYEHELTKYAFDVLKDVPGITIYGPKNDAHCSVISFNIEGIHAHDIGTLLDRENIAVRVGHHCTMPLMNVLGIHGTARASLSFYNSREDIDKLKSALLKAREVFKL
jgi:cysteine desulfurase / selenocysteine lyase